MNIERFYIFISLLFSIAQTIQITPEQDKIIDKLANYYSKLILSFDPQEIPFNKY